VLGDDAEALAGLRRTEEGLRDFAAAHGMVLREEQPWPGYVPAARQPGPVKHGLWSLAGELPGGAIGRLRHQAVFGTTLGMDVKGQHTILVSRIPESVGWVPMLCCRPDELMSGTYYWGGDGRKRQSQTFESAELDRRFEVEVAPGQSQLWIYQLFTPSFIDWLAHTTPRDFGFKLDLGVLTCETPQWRGQPGALTGELDPGALELLLETGGTVASRLRDEVLEEADGLGRAAEIDSAAAYAAWATAPKHGRIVGAILRLAQVGMDDDGTADFAAERGMSRESPADFHGRYLGLAMPGAAVGAVTGVLPGSDREGSVAWLEYSSEVDIERTYVAVAVATDGPLPVTWFDPDDVGVPGAGDDLPAAVTERVAAAGWGLSTATHAACVYMPTSGTVAGVEIDAFVTGALELLTDVESITER